MKQHIEIIGRASSIKETRTAKGYVYSFALPIEGQDKEGERLTEWLRCSKERRPELLEHRGELHVIGELQALPAWGDYPQKIGLWGFHIEPVLGRVWRIAKGRRNPPRGQERERASSLPASRDQPFPDMGEDHESIPF